MQLEEIYRPPEADLEHQAPAQALPQKVALLSLATFGLYHLYWFYQHWTRRKAHGEDVIPFLRAIFGVWFMYSLCQSVNRELERRAGPGPSFSGLAYEPLNTGVLAFGYFGLNMLWRFDGVLSFAGLLSFLPLFAVQRRINQLHEEMGIDPSQGSSYTTGTIVALVLGALCWLLIGTALFMSPA
jgi:hypothetical protein